MIILFIDYMMQWHLNIFNLFGHCQQNYSVENLWKIILAFKVVIFFKTKLKTSCASPVYRY